MKIKLKRLHPDAKMPTHGTEDSACADLYAIEDITFHSGDVKCIRSGWAFEIPKGYYVEIYPRSGLACKKQLIILNSPCIIDSDYRGEVYTYMRYIGGFFIPTIKKGDRYAQMILKKCIYTTFKEVNELSETERNAGGFGSTGR